MTGPWCAIGIDLGGTHTRVGLVDASGTLLNMRRGPTLRSVPEFGSCFRVEFPLLGAERKMAAGTVL